jgi:hypothetical protein
MSLKKKFILYFLLLSLELPAVIHKVQTIDDKMIWSAFLNVESNDELFSQLQYIDKRIQFLEVRAPYFKSFVYDRYADGETVWQKLCKSLNYFRDLEYLGLRLQNFNGFKSSNINDIKALSHALNFIKPGVSIIISTVESTSTEALICLVLALSRSDFHIDRRGEFWHKAIEMKIKDEAKMTDKTDEIAEVEIKIATITSQYEMKSFESV